MWNKFNMSCWKGLFFIVAVCLSQILLTYLAMVVIPKTRMTKDPNYYRAAVLEYIPFIRSNLSIAEVVKVNLNNFAVVATFASSHGTDILIFPESVLYGDVDNYKSDRLALIDTYAEDVPNPQQGNYTPCDEKEQFINSSVLRNLSCMAKHNNMFVVANMVDYKKCLNVGESPDRNTSMNCLSENDCPKDGIYLYNTNVVFNRNGKLIARYHKKHLYYEPTMNPSNCPDDGFFETDFGNFTTSICFDILFKEFEENIEKTAVDNVAYPYYWFDHTPYYFFADIVQHAYAVYNKINILAANAHVPATGSVGSGIFSGLNGALIYSHQPDGQSKLLISNVPKKPKNLLQNFDKLDRKRFVIGNGTFLQVDIEDKFLYQNECNIEKVGPPHDMLSDYRCGRNNLSEFQFRKLELPSEEITLCDQSFCCKLTYKAKTNPDDYILGVSAIGIHLNNMYDYKKGSCFLSRCTSEDGVSCNTFMLNSETIFESVDLRGTFISKYVYPFSVDSNIRITPKNQWTFDGNSQIEYQNLGTNTSLLFLGLFGTDFIPNT